MHRSQLSTFVIDCRSEDIDQATEFWSRALGKDVIPESKADPSYRSLVCSKDEAQVMVQKVSHESRIHLDIEADDLEKEVARLEKLGAKRIEFVKRWWVMEAPTGQRFCVVNPQRGPLGERANTWP
jgi:hypothetical protein